MLINDIIIPFQTTVHYVASSFGRALMKVPCFLHSKNTESRPTKHENEIEMQKRSELGKKAYFGGKMNFN